MKTGDLEYSVLLIGSGKLAGHLQTYFAMLRVNFQTWNRKQDEKTLQQLVHNKTHIYLAIADFAIKSFYQKWQHLFSGKVVVHFSGALHIE
ncbi:MAG: hypothetical protein ACHQ1D_08845, partial [Nitrososphaerales archaeon]